MYKIKQTRHLNSDLHQNVTETMKRLIHSFIKEESNTNKIFLNHLLWTGFGENTQ